MLVVNKINEIQRASHPRSSAFRVKRRLFDLFFEAPFDMFNGDWDLDSAALLGAFRRVENLLRLLLKLDLMGLRQFANYSTQVIRIPTFTIGYEQRYQLCLYSLILGVYCC